jgi:uncharacterized protein (UPF0248 family)
MAKNILNLMLWHPEQDISQCQVTYLHRGAPENLRTIQGSQVEKLEKGFLILEEDVHIPYHRIIKIECHNKVIWKKGFSE